LVSDKPAMHVNTTISKSKPSSSASLMPKSTLDHTKEVPLCPLPTVTKLQAIQPRGHLNSSRLEVFPWMNNLPKTIT